ELDRGGTHFAVIAVDAGSSSVTYTAAPGTHIVVGAPAGSTGRADVSAKQNNSACDVTITAHSGDGGYDAKPVVLKLDASCGATEDPTQQGFQPPMGNDPPPGSSVGDLSGGCCQSGRATDPLAPMLLIAFALIARRTRRTRRSACRRRRARTHPRRSGHAIPRPRPP